MKLTGSASTSYNLSLRSAKQVLIISFVDVWILTLVIAVGQLIKIPINSGGGVTLLDITVIVLCLIGISNLNFKLKRPPLFIASTLFFILIALFSLMLTPLHLQSIEYLTSFLYSVRFTAYVFLGWLIFSGAFPNLRNNINRILIFSGFSLAILGLTQFVFLPDLSFLIAEGWDPHYFRTVSTFLDPNFAGAFFVLTLILLLHSLGWVRLGWVRFTPWVFYVIFTIIYLALLTTFSRSSCLMFLVSGSAMAFLKKSKILFLATIFLFLGLMLGFQIYTQTVAQLRNIDRAKSASSRLNSWQQGLYLFQKFPILGVGFNAYRYGLKKYNFGDEQFLKSHGSSSNDSSLLFVAATTGSVGLLSFLYFIFSLIYTNYKLPAFGKTNNRIIMLPALLGLLIHSFFANSLFYPPILAWILLISAASKK